MTEIVDIKRGLRPECMQSSEFFTLYGEVIMRAKEMLYSISIGSRQINSIKYVDDTVLIAD